MYNESVVKVIINEKEIDVNMNEELFNISLKKELKDDLNFLLNIHHKRDKAISMKVPKEVIKEFQNKFYELYKNRYKKDIILYENVCYRIVLELVNEFFLDYDIIFKYNCFERLIDKIVKLLIKLCFILLLRNNYKDLKKV